MSIPSDAANFGILSGMTTANNSRLIPNASADVVFGGFNVVVVSDAINPAAISPVWFLQSGVVRQDELSEAPVFTPGVLLFPCRNFHLVITPGRYQLNLTADGAEMSELVSRVVGGLVSSNQALRFTATGVNFDYFVAPKSVPFAEWNRTAFPSPFSDLLADAKVPRFGLYFSSDVGLFRMKLDVKPLKGAQSPDAQLIEALATRPEWMIFRFNFHADLDPAQGSSELLKVVGEWQDAARFARKVVLDFVEK